MTARNVLLALVPAGIVLVATLVLGWAGDVDAFGSVDVYRVVMNAAALGRFLGLFAGVALVWVALRSRSAPRWVLALAVVSGPIAYAVTAVADMLAYFPVGQAFYYGLNPLTVAGLSCQVATAALVEVIWRAVRREPIAWVLPVVIVGGYLALYFTVLFRGGVAYFFVYQQGYLLLFT